MSYLQAPIHVFPSRENSVVYMINSIILKRVSVPIHTCESKMKRDGWRASILVIPGGGCNDRDGRATR